MTRGQNWPQQSGEQRLARYTHSHQTHANRARPKTSDQCTNIGSCTMYVRYKSKFDVLELLFRWSSFILLYDDTGLFQYVLYCLYEKAIRIAFFCISCCSCVGLWSSCTSGSCHIHVIIASTGPWKKSMEICLRCKNFKWQNFECCVSWGGAVCLGKRTKNTVTLAHSLTVISHRIHIAMPFPFWYFG